MTTFAESEEKWRLLGQRALALIMKQSGTEQTCSINNECAEEWDAIVAEVQRLHHGDGRGDVLAAENAEEGVMVKPYVVLVTGGRDYADQKTVDRTLFDLCSRHPWVRILQGEARGADALARDWAIRSGAECHGYPADWAAHGKSAGPRRNATMLTVGKPDVVVAFPGGRGTADMVRRARLAGVPVIEAVP